MLSKPLPLQQEKARALNMRDAVFAKWRNLYGNSFTCNAVDSTESAAAPFVGESICASSDLIEARV